MMRILSALLLILASFPLEARTEPTAQVDIGVLLPLSGNAADEGEMCRRGFELALDRINASHDQYRIKLLYEDTLGDPKNAVSAYRNLRLRSGAKIFLTWGSGVGMALLSLVDSAGALQMGVATSTPSYRVAGDNSFRVFPSAAEEAAFDAKFVMTDLKYHKAAILAVNNDYGQGLANHFEKAFTSAGGTITARENFQPGESDFQSSLTRIKASEPEIIYLSSYPGSTPVLLRQASALKLPARFISSSASVATRDFLKLSGKAAEGLLVVLPGPDIELSSRPEIVSFREEYFKKFGENADLFQTLTARSYDALNIIARAIAACNSEVDIPCLKVKLLSLGEYPGVMGPIRFDEAGDANSMFSVKVVKDGKYSYL